MPWVSIQLLKPTTPILTVPIATLPVSVAEKALDGLSSPPPLGRDVSFPLPGIMSRKFARGPQSFSNLSGKFAACILIISSRSTIILA
jgi:hypothetical protein